MNMVSPDPNRYGVFFLSPLERAKAEQATLGSTLIQVKLNGFKSKTAVLKALGRALKFPEHYGQNFDALSDCLTDPDFWPAKSYVLFVDGLQTLQKVEPKACTTLLEIFRSATEEWRASGKPFSVLLDAPFPGIAPFKA
ncbi:MAG: Barstar (barnase inhibitor) [Betaproteobacteria bacterium ADurb.Bin341]|nr:MAG: Barstar (barnase inhibitor) [Betaproteobacteria bacterium ADurb.Bin341]